MGPVYSVRLWHACDGSWYNEKNEKLATEGAVITKANSCWFSQSATVLSQVAIECSLSLQQITQVISLHFNII